MSVGSALDAALARTDRPDTEDILGHARFPVARRRLLAALTISMDADGDAGLRHLLNGAGRAALFSIIIGRYFHYLPDDRRTWPTAGLIQRRYLPLGFSGIRTLDDVLGRLAAMGLITRERHAADARTRLVLPTARMLELDRKWIVNQYSSVEALFPQVAAGGVLADGDTRYQRVLHHIASHTVADTPATLATLGPLQAIVFRQDGLRILAACLIAADEAGVSTLALPFQRIEQTASTSRTHVRHVFQSLEELGLVRLHQPGGRSMQLSPALHTHVDRFVATVIANYAAAWQAACWLVRNDAGYAQSVPTHPTIQLLS